MTTDQQQAPPVRSQPEITHLTLAAGDESKFALGYDWTTRDWTVPVNAHLSDGRAVPAALKLTPRQARALAYGLRNPPLPAD
ncbi:hypothetical protein [Streptacidiphilus jiangxiensis]|uniref:Uncharacterized protein n=1 Tax=Streptacidiphilus jiangxiensis TaxID=235985 RepID=A0A1H7H2S0_STRJI|nr:hypothetical protein [Streptacidiphilus jiangxiensis]SEK44538.1 hypothetical protein SAMN05414137_10252 [Streptacidiphilus jiangxiensis]